MNTTKTTIRVTPEFAAQVSALVTTGKTPWLIVKDDFAVGVFVSRAKARQALDSSGVTGTVVKAADVNVEFVDLKATAAKPAKTKKEKPAKVAAAKVELTEQEQAKIDEKGNPLNCRVCPECGSTEIFHGRVDAKTGMVEDEDCCGGCHHCDWSFDFSILRKSQIESPCFVVWDTADKMVGARRKDVLAACTEKGIAFYTARTQYQLWLTSKKADEAAKAHKGSK